ncbi:mitogen-activated protein kinase kinase kinase npk1 [Phtheirospermum japonicum]|uniref:Mitogen-activated protein kinase kinase kinase npk1 n=1 Tax=Phtheirospermum japonicum TaxID=374723 RepID=A0A830D570_9LAMI|nr:mitogen-activated protein kinase kinase kinase npk1 [Phtheirospermum japonicum]
MDWVRGEKLGHGSFAMVSLAVARSQSSKLPPLMAVKSCGVSLSSSLMSEKLILEELKDCPEIIRCFGGSFSRENGELLYNILLEYASGGSLADKLKTSAERRLPEFEARRYTKALLRGLDYIHKSGFVHCDLKLQNILLCQNDAVKIADFGLAKKTEERGSGYMRGTPMYMSPEMAAGGDQGAAADVWALGCAVAEMITGSPVWRCSDVAGLLMKIGGGDESPEIPMGLSEEGKDFLEKCFVKDPNKRWTAEMLLDHPFICDQDFGDREEKYKASTSPRCAFDFPDDWISSPEHSPEPGSWLSVAAAGRLQELVSGQSPDWSVSDGWVTVR